MIPPRLTIRHVAVIVAEDFNTSLTLLRGSSRKAELAHARQVAMYLAHHHVGQSSPVIGQFFSRDHSTVIHAIRAVAEKAAQDDALKDRLQTLGERISVAEGQILANAWIPSEPELNCEELPPITVTMAPPPATDEPGARRVLDAVRGYVESRKALKDAEHTRGEYGARRQVEAEYALLDRAWRDYVAGRDRS